MSRYKARDACDGYACSGVGRVPFMSFATKEYFIFCRKCAVIGRATLFRRVTVREYLVGRTSQE